ncbi:MAG: bifunctional heptose 7-phosphate kinase/heptose 1-phosphate adenyltransferase [Terriglobales bacterium]
MSARPRGSGTAAHRPGLASILARAQGRRVAICGDVMLDHFLWGDATRISPEAPVPVILLERESDTLGGAANVALNIAALGGRAALFGAIGDDAAGARVRELLAAAGVETGGLLVLPGRPTTVKQRVFARNKHVLRIDREQTLPLDGAARRRLLAAFAAAAARDGFAASVVSDYGKGTVTPALWRGWMAVAQRWRLPVCADPKSRQLRYAGAAMLKPNARELAHLTGMPVDGEAAIARAAARVLRRHGCQSLLVTRGGEGMLLFAGGSMIRISSAALEVADVTGAGDTVAAALALALAVGAAPAAAARLASAAAAVVVAKPGTAVATHAELRAALQGAGGRRPPRDRG